VTPSLLLRTVLPGSEPCLRARFEFPSAKRQQYLTRLDTRLHGALQASTQTSCAMGRIGEAAPRTGSGMIKRRSQVLGVWFLCWDLFLTAAAWLLAYYIRIESGWLPLTKEAPDFYLCWRDLPLILILAAVAYRLTGQYTIHRLRRLREEVVAVFKGTALLSLL